MVLASFYVPRVIIYFLYKLLVIDIFVIDFYDETILQAKQITDISSKDATAIVARV